MKKIVRSLINTHAPAAVILIRLSVGAIFVSEGIQKLLFPAVRGAGRFERIGFEAAEILGPFVGVFEIACGALVLLGLATRFAALPLVVIMVTAIISTKIPILVGHDLWGFQVRELSTYGFWSMAHESRTDFAMLLGSLFLVILGGGRWSLDAFVTRRSRHEG